MLVYGKAVTPLAGDWSAEPWTPPAPLRPTVLASVLESAEQAVELDEAPTERDGSTVADTAVYQEQVLESPMKPESQQHVAFVYRHNPYNSHFHKVEMYRCQCDGCLDASATGTDYLSAQVFHRSTTSPLSHTAASFPPSYYDAYAHGMDAYPSDEYANPVGFDDTSSQTPTAEYTEPTHSASYWPPETAPVSSFVPPPPPPRITRRVMAESAEGTLDVDAAFYHITMRWYNKVAAVQERHAPANDLCPVPAQEGVSFDQWVDQVGRWWLRHFEHAQVKTSTSSALLRTSYGARPQSFQTHTSNGAAHQLALRSGPRRERGSSGLTAAMLQSLEGDTTRTGLPTPRSALAQRRQSELAW